MNKVIIISLLSVFLSVDAWAQNNDWQLIWHDEFEVEGRPDSTKWTYEHGFERNEELQWYTPENAFQRDGYLVIEARPADLPCPSYREGSRHWRNNRPRILWTSSSLKTRGLFSFQYGRVEVCARIPVCLGAWPAIWLLGDSGGWPACGEIDMMEYYQYKGRPTVPFWLMPVGLGIERRNGTPPIRLSLTSQNATLLGQNVSMFGVWIGTKPLSAFISTMNCSTK